MVGLIFTKIGSCVENRGIFRYSWC